MHAHASSGSLTCRWAVTPRGDSYRLKDRDLGPRPRGPVQFPGGVDGQNIITAMIRVCRQASAA
jgi:hypothetical protein